MEWFFKGWKWRSCWWQCLHPRKYFERYYNEPRKQHISSVSQMLNTGQPSWLLTDSCFRHQGHWVKYQTLSEKTSGVVKGNIFETYSSSTLLKSYFNPVTQSWLLVIRRWGIWKIMNLRQGELWKCVTECSDKLRKIWFQHVTGRCFQCFFFLIIKQSIKWVLFKQGNSSLKTMNGNSTDSTWTKIWDKNSAFSCPSTRSLLVFTFSPSFFGFSFKNRSS